MRKAIYLMGAVVALLAVSCAKEQNENENEPLPVQDVAVRFYGFYSSIETSDDTRAYAGKGLCLSWDADDRISVFNKSSQNEEYRFTGETGDNSGWFELVQHKGSSEGNKLDYTYAVHPYQETTSISNSGALTMVLPAEQSFRNGSFGSGTNVMVARTDEYLLQFRNVLGYLVLKIYGSGIQVSSVTLKGNDGEILAGNAELTISQDGVPSLTMLPNGKETLTLVCETPVVPGATLEEAAEFWFALPPTTFGKGYTVEITDAEGNTFTEVINKSIEVARNRKVSTDPIWLLGDGLSFVSVDKKPVFTLTSVTGGDTTGGYQEWKFYSDKELRVKIISWPCTCSTQDHNGYHLTLAELDIPGITLLSIPLMRSEGDDYNSTNKSVAGAHLNDYRITEDGTHLDFDLSVTLYQETDGDIRIVYSGPVTPALQNPEDAALLPGIFTTSDGRKLRFSKGNLQAVLNNGVITKWQFAENQWDTVGDISMLTDETGVVDQFTYSTTAPLNRWGIHPLFYDMEVNHYMTNYQMGSYRPQWRNPDLVAEYGDGWVPFNLYAVAMTFDHKVEYPRGVYDAYYNANCTTASIDGVGGLVLFPDNYVQPDGIPLERFVQIIYSNNVGYYTASPALSSDQANAYTAAQWAEMEAAGAVFLPKGLYNINYGNYNFSESYFSNFPLSCSHYYVRMDLIWSGFNSIFADSAGPEYPDMIRLVKYVE